MSTVKIQSTVKIPPGFTEMVRTAGPITLGDARKYASSLPADKKKMSCCACKKVRCSTEGCCCKGGCVALSCNLLCGRCLWYGCWYCACKHGDDGEYNCTDLKGNFYVLVPVNESGTLACFTENTHISSKGEELKVQCYCE